MGALQPSVAVLALDEKLDYISPQAKKFPSVKMSLLFTRDHYCQQALKAPPGNAHLNSDQVVLKMKKEFQLILKQLFPNQ